ncbi:DUF1217 domain-containing protein [Bradyrhizobium guangdongense]
MVSTYFSYSYIARNLTQSLTRVAQQSDVSREAAYYKANIGKVHSVDDLMNDYRLYHYVTKAYGLEDMAYAKAFMKKVLQSDLTDPKSFANTLIDKRYRDFAAAFSFGGGMKVAQSNNQTDDMIGLYTAAMKSNVDAVAAETKYYNAAIGNVTGVDQLLNDDRLRNYIASAFGIDQSKWSRDTIKQVLSSDPSDPNSYVNVTFASKLDGLNAQLAQAKSDATDASSKITDYTAQLSQPGAKVDQLNVQILVERYRLQSAVSSMSTTNDTIVATNRFMNLATAYEFSADGSLPPGTPAQTATNLAITNQSFDDSKSAVYAAASPLQEALVIGQFRKAIPQVTSLQALMSNASAYNFALAAVGLDPAQVSQSTVKAVLESDLSDPKSYVYTLKDDRYVKLAQAFNFDAKGNLTTPLAAQDPPEILDTAKNYIIAKLKAASKQDQAKVKAQAQKDATDYQQAVGDIKSVSDLLANRKMVDFILVAKGLDPAKVSTAYLKKIFASDLNDPKSFANTESDPRFAEIAASFNFDSKVKVARLAMMGPQKRDQFLATRNDYLQQSLEQQQGDTNPGVRLALYFQRMAGHVTSAFDILADKALSEVFRTTFDLPDQMASMQIDQQAKIVEKYLNIKDLSDPAKVAKLLSRFSAMYDAKNASQTYSPVLDLFQGSSSRTSGFSESTYLAMAKMKANPW